MTLDLSDERNAVLDMRASLHYLETALLEEWGIQVVQFSELADVPLLTADGLRLAHHNGWLISTSSPMPSPWTTSSRA